MKWASRVDTNHRAVVTELRQMGLSVRDTSRLGQGFPDIVVGRQNRNYLFEIKDPDKKPSARRLTPDEATFHNAWRGQVDTIHSAAEALAIIQQREAYHADK